MGHTVETGTELTLAREKVVSAREKSSREAVRRTNFIFPDGRMVQSDFLIFQG